VVIVYFIVGGVLIGVLVLDGRDKHRLLIAVLTAAISLHAIEILIVLLAGMRETMFFIALPLVAGAMFLVVITRVSSRPFFVSAGRAVLATVAWCIVAYGVALSAAEITSV
jgi:hypothetical protein